MKINQNQYLYPKTTVIMVMPRLDKNSPIEILEGAENGSEMGVFNSLFNSQKEKILKSILKEYTRAGLDVGIFTVT